MKNFSIKFRESNISQTKHDTQQKISSIQSKNILENYHQRYSEKFESKLRLIVIIEAMLSQ